METDLVCTLTVTPHPTTGIMVTLEYNRPPTDRSDPVFEYGEFLASVLAKTLSYTAPTQTMLAFVPDPVS